MRGFLSSAPLGFPPLRLLVSPTASSALPFLDLAGGDGVPVDRVETLRGKALGSLAGRGALNRLFMQPPLVRCVSLRTIFFADAYLLLAPLLIFGSPLCPTPFALDQVVKRLPRFLAAVWRDSVVWNSVKVCDRLGWQGTPRTVEIFPPFDILDSGESGRRDRDQRIGLAPGPAECPFAMPGRSAKA